MTLRYNQECEKNLGNYVCRLDDSNYFFVKCYKLYIIPLPINDDLTTNEIYRKRYFDDDVDPAKIFKNLRFIYEKDGKIFEEPLVNVAFALTEFSLNHYSFSCDIGRPISLITRKGYPDKIAIHFSCDSEFQSIQFVAESLHEDYLSWNVCNVF